MKLYPDRRGQKRPGIWTSGGMNLIGPCCVCGFYLAPWEDMTVHPGGEKVEHAKHALSDAPIPY